MILTYAILWDFVFLLLGLIHGMLSASLTLKVPITTAADDKFFEIFPNFRKK